MKKEVRKEIYPEYIKKYSDYNLNEYVLKLIEINCCKTYNKSEMGLNLDTYIRINLYFEVLSQLRNNIEELDVYYKYKALVVGHLKEVTQHLSDDEIDIIYDDTIEDMKKHYDRTEALGSYIIRNFRSNLINYTNENYNTSFKQSEVERKIKTLNR